MHRSADFAEGIQRGSQFDRDQFVAEVLLSGGLGGVQAIDAASEAVAGAGGGGGEPFAAMGRLKREAVDDFGFEGGDAFSSEGRDAEVYTMSKPIHLSVSSANKIFRQ